MNVRVFLFSYFFAIIPSSVIMDVSVYAEDGVFVNVFSALKSAV